MRRLCTKSHMTILLVLFAQLATALAMVQTSTRQLGQTTPPRQLSGPALTSSSQVMTEAPRLDVGNIARTMQEKKEEFRKDYETLDESRYVRSNPGRFNFNRFGWYQQRNKEVAIDLFKKYSKLRILTSEEELIAGKFASVGAKLTRARKIVERKLGREPSDLEWAQACNIPVDKLNKYLEIAQLSKNRLVQHNIRMVEFWAKKISLYSDVAKTISYAELMVEGVAGLTKAAERYDGRGVRFYHFAEIYVRSALLEAVSKLKSGSIASHKSVMVATRAKKASAVLAKQLQRQPSSAEVAEMLGMSEGYLKSAMRDYNLKVTSGDQPLQEGYSELPSWEFHVKNDEIGTDINNKQQIKDALMEALDCSGLKSVEKRILALSSGILDGKERPVSHVAELMCMSNESVRLHLQAAQEKVAASHKAQAIIQSTRVRASQQVTGPSSRLSAARLY